MTIKRGRLLYLLLALLPVLYFTGCAGTVKHMSVVPPSMVVSAPPEGKSMVVFMRPSGIGFAIQSSVFEIKDGYPSLIGVVAAKKKVTCELEPGSHLFMVIGENADFMSAELEANKTYYALVTPRMGVWKARFSLKPVHADELDSPEFTKWLDGCEWVEKTSDSENWANNHMPSIQSKRDKYYEKWMGRDVSERPKLLPQDGR